MITLHFSLSLLLLEFLFCFASYILYRTYLFCTLNNISSCNSFCSGGGEGGVIKVCHNENWHIFIAKVDLYMNCYRAQCVFFHALNHSTIESILQLTIKPQAFLWCNKVCDKCTNFSFLRLILARQWNSSRLGRNHKLLSEH